MIQKLIDDRFGVFYNVFDIAQWLKNLGFSFQKAACISELWMKRSDRRGAPRPGLRFSVARKNARPCSCLAMKHRFRSGALAHTRGRGVASNPRSRPPASAKALRSSA